METPSTAYNTKSQRLTAPNETIEKHLPQSFQGVWRSDPVDSRRKLITAGLGWKLAKHISQELSITQCNTGRFGSAILGFERERELKTALIGSGDSLVCAECKRQLLRKSRLQRHCGGSTQVSQSNGQTLHSYPDCIMERTIRTKCEYTEKWAKCRTRRTDAQKPANTHCGDARELDTMHLIHGAQHLFYSLPAY